MLTQLVFAADEHREVLNIRKQYKRFDYLLRTLRELYQTAILLVLTYR